MTSPLFIVAGYVGYTVVSTIIGSSELRAHPFKLDIIAGLRRGIGTEKKIILLVGKIYQQHGEPTMMKLID